MFPITSLNYMLIIVNIENFPILVTNLKETILVNNFDNGFC